MSRRFLNVREVAAEFGKSTETIRNWCDAGLLPGAHQPVKGGHWVIPSAALDQFGQPANPYPARTARARNAKRKTP